MAGLAAPEARPNPEVVTGIKAQGLFIAHAFNFVLTETQLFEICTF